MGEIGNQEGPNSRDRTRPDQTSPRRKTNDNDNSTVCYTFLSRSSAKNIHSQPQHHLTYIKTSYARTINMILPTATIILASLFTLISSLLTLHHIHAHLVNYKNPKIQRKAIRIIIMPALYAITSWIQILSTNLAVVTEAVRGVYEAFVVWTFFGVLIEYAGTMDPCHHRHSGPITSV